MAAEPVALLRRPVTQVPGASVVLLPELIGLVYEGLNETTPWYGLAERLRHVLVARNVTVTLHHSDDRPSDLQVMSVEPHDETDGLLDPESVLPGDILVFGPRDVEPDCAEFMRSLDVASCLRTCFAEPGGMRCWVDVVRGHNAPEQGFSSSDVGLIRNLLPHLFRALGLYARLQRREAERSIYEGCLDHLVLGCRPWRYGSG